jgi:DNA modification methylase
MTHAIIAADLLAYLRGNRWLVQNGYLPKVHAILCDPPYGLEFMGKEWDKPKPSGSRIRDPQGGRGVDGWGRAKLARPDAYVAGEDFQHWVTEWAELLIDYVYPGGLLMAFGGTRTYHRLAAGLEDAGWEISDCIMWVTGQGFPKSKRLDESSSPHLSADDLCQCADSRNNSARSVPMQQFLDRIGTVCQTSDAMANEARSAPNDSQTPVGSQGNCPDNPCSYGELLHRRAMAVLALIQRLEDVQEHNRSSVLDDDRVSEPLRSLFQVLRSDLPAMRDYLHPSSFARASQLLQECEDDRYLGECLNNCANTLAGSLNVTACVAVDRSMLHTLHIDSWLVCLPRSILRVMASTEYATIIPEISFCIKCGKPFSRFSGFGSALKPSHEPCVVARAPRGKRTYAALAREFGTGALAIDAARIESTGKDTTSRPNVAGKRYEPKHNDAIFGTGLGYGVPMLNAAGRWPANFALVCTCESDDHAADCPVAVLGAQSGVLTSGDGNFIKDSAKGYRPSVFGEQSQPAGTEMTSYGDTGTAARFFYTAKAAAWEREVGLAGFARGIMQIKNPRDNANPNNAFGDGARARVERGDTLTIPRANVHPTVKPIRMAEYLATLLLPPELDGPRRLLVPFAGSGSEMIGALLAGWDDVTGIEREAEYVAIARARVGWWAQFGTYDAARAAYEKERKARPVVIPAPVVAEDKPAQMALFEEEAS